MKNENIFKQIENEYKAMTGDKVKEFKEAVRFLNWFCSRGHDCNWGIQYYGFGEHLVFWSPYEASWWDFGIDAGTAINWNKMKDIIVECAEHTRQEYNKHRRENETTKTK